MSDARTRGRVGGLLWLLLLLWFGCFLKLAFDLADSLPGCGELVCLGEGFAAVLAARAISARIRSVSLRVLVLRASSPVSRFSRDDESGWVRTGQILGRQADAGLGHSIQSHGGLHGAEDPLGAYGDGEATKLTRAGVGPRVRTAIQRSHFPVEELHEPMSRGSPRAVS